MTERAGGRWGPTRSWRAGGLAVTAGLVLLVAACGGSPSPAGSSGSDAGGSTQAQQDLAYAQCMRSHGVTDYPDPSSGGGFGAISSQVQDNPDYGTADHDCRHLLPGGGQLPSGENKVEQNLPQLLKLAQCMRSHGVPHYPDPDPNRRPGPGITNNRQELALEGVDPNSPQFQAASQTCERLLPLPSGSPSQGGRS